MKKQKHYCRNCGCLLYHKTKAYQTEYKHKRIRLCYDCFVLKKRTNALPGIDNDLFQPVTDGKRYIFSFSDGSVSVYDFNELINFVLAG